MNAVGWFEIYVNDMERAKKFYENVLGVQLKAMEMPDAEFNKGLEMWMFPEDYNSYGATGALCKMEGVSAGQNSVLVYFGCEDCKIEEERVAENGGKVSQSKFSIGEHGFISVVHDSEGNMFGLHSMK